MTASLAFACWLTVAVVANLASLKVVAHMFRYRHCMLVHARGPLLAIAQSLSILYAADIYIVQDLMMMLGKPVAGKWIMLNTYAIWGIACTTCPLR